ncbi:Ankyrin [Mycena sanguinolenta]|uniref:Ankyrin n=1 Tax=Mycena sanguinolenta TaxID=230812 RepID=A0A8H7CIQ9_9AGAR|nr:Ankyrin [Mycena sanguinolenta]
MVVLTELPPELILWIVTFLTRETVLNTDSLSGYQKSEEPQTLPDLSSINALSRTNSIFHRTLSQSLYDACASVEPLGKLALLFAAQNQLESAVERLVAAGVDLDSDFYCSQRPYSTSRVLHIAAGLGHRSMVVKLLTMYGAEATAKVHARTEFPCCWTPLDYAAYSERLEVVRLLAPIRLPAPQVDGGPPLDPVQAHRQYLGRALVGSARAGNIEICEYLISLGGRR